MTPLHLIQFPMSFRLGQQGRLTQGGNCEQLPNSGSSVTLMRLAKWCQLAIDRFIVLTHAGVRVCSGSLSISQLWMPMKCIAVAVAICCKWVFALPA